MTARGLELFSYTAEMFSVILLGLIITYYRSTTCVFSCSFYRAMHMHKRGICCHPVSVRPCVRHVRELRQNE